MTRKTININDLYSLEDTAALLGYSRGRVSQLIKEGKIATVKIGRRVHTISGHDIKAYIDARPIKQVITYQFEGEE